jgi:hypothetical protein
MRGFQHLGHYLAVRMRGHFQGEPEKMDLGIFEKKKTGLDAMTGRFGALLRAGRRLMLRPDVKITDAHAEVEHVAVHGADLKAVMLKKWGGLASLGRGLLLKPGMNLRDKAQK